MINFFRKQPEDEITKLLKASQQDFRFHQDLVKLRILSSLKSEILTPTKFGVWHFAFMHYGAVIAIVVLCVSVTFVKAAQSQPGETLFPLNKLGEKLVLGLPLSAQQKAQFQTSIVSKRLKSLEQIKTQQDGLTSMEWQNKQLETIKESDESLRSAVETISATQAKFQTLGQTNDAENLSQILGQLDSLAQAHEENVLEIENETLDGNIKQAVDMHLNQIREIHHRTQMMNLKNTPDLNLNPAN